MIEHHLRSIIAAGSLADELAPHAAQAPARPVDKRTCLQAAALAYLVLLVATIGGLWVRI